MRNLSDRPLGKPYISRKPYISPLVKALWAAGAVLLALAVLVPAASAKTVTLHYFSRQTSSTILTAQGQPLAPNTQPSVDDITDQTGIDYVGNHKHHAKRATASDHLSAPFGGPAPALSLGDR
jgi:hypothetical protein